jgi:hypothetical protein
MNSSTDLKLIAFIIVMVGLIIGMIIMMFITRTAVEVAEEKGYNYFWRLWFVGIFTAGIGACIMVAILPDRKCRNRYIAIREPKGRY